MKFRVETTERLKLAQGFPFQFFTEVKKKYICMLQLSVNRTLDVILPRLKIQILCCYNSFTSVYMENSPPRQKFYCLELLRQF